MATIDPQKYIVFNRSDWLRGWMAGEKPDELADAVVIRKQDRFAHTALSAYAAGVLNAAEIIEATAMEFLDDVELQHLYELADFFAGLADEGAFDAEEEAARLISSC